VTPHAVRGAGQHAVEVAGRPLPAHERLRSLSGVDDRVKRLVFNLDQLGCINGLRAGLGDHCNHRLTDVSDLVAGQDRVRDVGNLGVLEGHHR